MFRATLISLFLTSTALATTWTVDDDGKANFDNIQAAIDASSDGDEIIVMPGTYTSTQDGHVVNMLGKAVTLRSSDPSDPDVVAATIIDGEDTRRGLACYNQETSKTIISGFTITNGFGAGFDYNGDGDIDWQEESGGGMYNENSSPTLENCTFTGNSANHGGGMYNTSSSPTLTNCTFTGNTANDGGGMRNWDSSSPTLTNCTFTGNTAIDGGGMQNYINSSPTLTNCTFENNTGGGMRNDYKSSPTIDGCIFTGNTSYVGGGMLNHYYSNPTLTDCTFENNNLYGGTNNHGGGMYNNQSSPTLTNCTFVNNNASGWHNYGGGMYNYRSNPTFDTCTFTANSANDGGGMYNNHSSNPTLTGCTFTGNTASFDGGGMHNNYLSSPTLTDCTFTENTANHGGGMYNYNHSPTLTGCTFTNNTATNGGGMYNWDSSSPTLTNCTFENNSATNDGGGMYNYYSSSPTLRDSRFCGNSPTQIEGDWNDLGWNLFWDVCNDCNGNGIDDFQDIVDGTSLDCDNDLTPDECQYDCDGDGIPDPTELYCYLTQYDINGDGVPDECQDCNENGVPDDLDIAKGYSFDCNENGIPDECEDDCNGNTIPDDCETFADCNENGIPDECEAFSDCNGNGVPDECETGNDCNENGIPDECETFADCNGNGIPDECEEDCNGNTIPDECETLPDCNENGTPDECETFPDCNENGIPDECDISSGLEEDCNENGVPDSCDVYFDDYVQRNVIIPQEMHEGYFGATVSISGNTAIVGSRLDPNWGGYYGEGDPVTIYRFNGTHWIIEATLTSEDPYFGVSVAIDGEIAVVGSLYVEDVYEGGLAYVYRYNGSFWVEEAVIDAYDEETSDYPNYFGASISIYNDTIVIGAPETETEGDDGTYHIGAAYVYHYDGSEWIKEAVLSNPEADDSWGHFGWSVSIDDGTVVIGDPWADYGTGAAYVFKFLNGEWSGATQLLASDGEEDDAFGFSVSVSGDNVIVGAHRKSSAEYNEDGAAYIYTYADSEWGNETKLLPQANEWGEYFDEAMFGISVSIDSNVCVVGQPGTEEGNSCACIYRFEEGIWSEPELIASSSTDDVWYERGFGWSVSLDGSYLMIGSPFEYGTFSAGKVFFFQEKEGDCNANGILDECEIADGSVQDNNGNGIPDDCECLADVTGDGTVSIEDLLSLIAVWGTNNPIGDINYDNEVNVADLLVLIAAWGDCP